MKDREDWWKIIWDWPVIRPRMSSVPLEQDEKISLCYLGLVLAAGSFDPDRGIRFATFAVPVMQNKILQGLRREKKHFGAISLEQPVGKDDGGTLADLVPDPGNSFRDLEELLDFQDAVKRTGRELSGKKLRLYQELLRNPGTGTEGIRGKDWVQPVPGIKMDEGDKTKTVFVKPEEGEGRG